MSKSKKERIEQPPVLSEADEAALDRAWEKVGSGEPYDDLEALVESDDYEPPSVDPPGDSQ